MQEKSPVDRDRQTWKDYIEMDLQAVGWGAWNGLFWLWIDTDGGLCQSSDELSGSIKCGSFLTW